MQWPWGIPLNVVPHVILAVLFWRGYRANQGTGFTLFALGTVLSEIAFVSALAGIRLLPSHGAAALTLFGRTARFLNLGSYSAFLIGLSIWPGKRS